MRTRYLAVPVCLLLMADAGAQSGKLPYPAISPSSTVQVTATAPTYRIQSDEQDRVAGRYAMSNGWRMQIEPTGNGIEARIDRRRPIQLVAQSADRFVSPDGNVTMEFNRGAHGDDMLMSYVPESSDPRLAQVIVIKATMAQR
ncbi:MULTISPECIES: hypothetical protein [unclassified Massilia]|uniref:hypothetical protein n=1 Tax=unclassified Massilia TaxID=2609279 RepID=UPI001B826B01|nr:MULTISPECIES: hypothetical protein [unclassified Massilia]MBQ5939502.1 hypothetical protein [Massilia sp. AB1]MBQ5962035.1 hypothetical protein [Massilia sp. ZL223]